MEIWLLIIVLLLITFGLWIKLSDLLVLSPIKMGQRIWHNLERLDQVKSGEKFLQDFQDLRVRSLLKMQSTQNESAVKTNSFLFYRPLLDELLRIESSLGVGLSQVLLEIKSSVLTDIKFVRQKQEGVRSTFFQMIFMSGLIFLFVRSCEHYLDLNFSWSLYFFIFVWQILGAILFYLVQQKREDDYFAAFSLWFFLLYRIRLYLKTHLETADFFSNTTLELEKIKLSEKKYVFNFERQSLLQILNHCRDHGLRGEQELMDLTQHLQDKREFLLDKFLRELAFFKFFILCFFFLLTYLGFVIYLFSFFMD